MRNDTLTQQAASSAAESGGTKRRWFKRGVKTNNSGGRGWTQSVPMPMVAFAIVALVIYVIILGWSSFQDPPRIKGKAEIKFDAWVAQLESRCHGDFSKLTPAEQKKLNGLTMGHGALEIKLAYQHLNG